MADGCPWCGKGRLQVTQWPGVLSCDECRTGTVARAGEERIGCCVPGCRRTRKAGKFTEWICANHWSTVPRQMHADWTAEKRLVRRILRRRPDYAEWWTLPPGSSGRLAALGMWRRVGAMWERCKVAAIEAAVGLR